MASVLGISEVSSFLSNEYSCMLMRCHRLNMFEQEISVLLNTTSAIVNSGIGFESKLTSKCNCVVPVPWPP